MNPIPRPFAATSLRPHRAWRSLGLALAFGGGVLGAAASRGAEVDPVVLEAQAERVKVVKQISACTLAIFAPSAQGGGSGVVISADGYALSNFHVTAECGNAMKCGMADGKLYDAVIVGVDPTGDVAMLKLLGRDDFPYAPLGDSDRLAVGDWCYVVGNPFLLANDFRPTVSYGVLSGLHRYQYPAGTLLEYTDCLQADAAINPGNSGGPMFDSAGNLIGINGRGSFEKRGRVNVGVGYAISINQIKNFMGQLRAGRIVDHATLGATVSADERRRVIVDDILEQSDAYRRGLRYGDEIVTFAGRTITSPNMLKNVLGIFPRGWRLPLSYRRKGVLQDTMVRLRGIHGDAELASLLDRRPEPADEPPRGDRGPKPGEPKPGQHKPGEPKLPGKPKPAAHKAEPMPEIVRKHFEARRGYVNYAFNKLNQDRVWNALAAGGLPAQRGGTWVLDAHQADGHAVTLTLAAGRASLEVAGERAGVDLGAALSSALDPPGSGGMLVALSCLRRLYALGPAHFGQVYYLGTEPLPKHEGLYDVLVGVHRDVECHFLFNTSDGRLAAVEMFADEDTDPCELHLSDYREAEGGLLPHRIEVVHGGAVYQTYVIDHFKFETER